MQYKGFYQGVSIIVPYGYLRTLTIKTEHGEKTFQVGFKKIEEQIKGLNKGDLVELEYENYDIFRIRKL